MKDGKARRVHKVYVGVVAHMGDGGRIDPLAVQWPDGRTFHVDEVMAYCPPGQLINGVETARYDVRFGRHETVLYLEYRHGSMAIGEGETLRWWVYAFDVTLPGSAG